MRDMSPPRLAAGQVLIRVAAVGLCGSDLHLFEDDYPTARLPQVQGHEYSGWVIDVGDGAEGHRPGSLVAVEPLRVCGRCYPCRRGRANACVNLAVEGIHAPGALRELVAVPAYRAFPADVLEPDVAALAEPASISLNAVTLADVQPGERVVLLGAGPIGLLALLAARDRRADVLVVDRLPARLRLAQELGASQVVDASECDVASSIEDWTDGEGAAVVIEAAGAASLVRLALDLVASTGRVVIVGISTQEVSVPISVFTRKELTVLGSRNSRGLFADAIGLLARHPVSARRLISHRFPLHQLADALTVASDPASEAGKVLITVSAEAA
jgi:L-gulonate 5-dehydrogenase